MPPKPWYQSRTIWLNALTVLATMASVFIEVLLNAGPVVTWSTVATGIVAALNVYLRTGTNQPITITGPVDHVGGTDIGTVTAGQDAFVGSSQTTTHDNAPPQ